MLKNGRLEFQRFDQRLEKVRDCSAVAAPQSTAEITVSRGKPVVGKNKTAALTV